MIQFFAPEIELTGQLPQEESQHCIKVLRHRAGDEICVIDGAGCRMRCRIIDPDPRSTMVEILEREEIPLYWKGEIVLAVAPTKNMERLEWLVEKGVEIGVDRIVPILCEHSERKVVKAERLRKIAVSAMKQSLKAKLPIVEELTPIEDFCKSLPQDWQKYMGYCDRKYPLRSLSREYQPVETGGVALLIGPEGDFSPAEVEMAVEAGFIPCTFGAARLRTETAGLVALDTLHLLNQLAAHPNSDNFPETSA